MLKKLLNTIFFSENKNAKKGNQEQYEVFTKKPPQEDVILLETWQKPSVHKAHNKSLSNEMLLDDLKSLIKDLHEEKQKKSFLFIKMTRRCANVLQREKIETPANLLSLSNTDILRWPNFGKKSIADLIAAIKKNDSADFNSLKPAVISEKKPNWVDQYLEKHPDQRVIFAKNSIIDESSYAEVSNYLESDVSYEADNFRYDFLSEYIDRKNPIEVLKISPSWLLKMDIFYFECDNRLKNIIDKYNIKTINDFEKFELKSLQNMGNKSILALAQCLDKAKKRGQPPSKKTINLSDKNLGDAFNASLNKITDKRHKLVIEQRLGVSGPVKTLEEIAQGIGLTRERVRQIQKKIIQKIKNGVFWDDHLKMCIMSVMESPNSPIYIDELNEIDPWFSGFEGNEKLLKNIIIHFSYYKAKFLEHNGRTILCHINNDEWEKLKSDILKSFEYTLDIRYTIEDIEMMVENRLANFESKELSSLILDEIYPVLNFSTSDFDIVLSSIGNSISSHLKAILNEEAAPLHYSKIRDLYQERYGVEVSERNIHARLNYGDFLLFNRGTYGTQKHLLLSEFEQKDIREQSEIFLEKHAKKQCHSHEILKFITGHDIDKYILSIIIQKSKKITYLGKMVWIFGDGDEENQRLPIKETVASILKKNGKPMHIEEMEKEITKFRSVNAHFSVNLQPNEIFSRVDPATWGLIERDFVLPEKEWREVKNYVAEYLTKINQALHTSEIYQTVQNLNLDKKITIGHIIGVLSADSRFRKWKGGFIGLSEWNSPKRITLDQAIDTILEKNASENYSIEIITNHLNEVLGYKFEQYKISTYLNKKGYGYDREKNLWVKVT